MWIYGVTADCLWCAVYYFCI